MEYADQSFDKPPVLADIVPQPAAEALAKITPIPEPDLIVEQEVYRPPIHPDAIRLYEEMIHRAAYYESLGPRFIDSIEVNIISNWLSFHTGFGLPSVDVEKDALWLSRDLVNIFMRRDLQYAAELSGIGIKEALEEKFQFAALCDLYIAEAVAGLEPVSRCSEVVSIARNMADREQMTQEQADGYVAAATRLLVRFGYDETACALLGIGSIEDAGESEKYILASELVRGGHGLRVPAFATSAFVGLKRHAAGKKFLAKAKPPFYHNRSGLPRLEPAGKMVIANLAAGGDQEAAALILNRTVEPQIDMLRELAILDHRYAPVYAGTQSMYKSQTYQFILDMAGSEQSLQHIAPYITQPHSDTLKNTTAMAVAAAIAANLVDNPEPTPILALVKPDIPSVIHAASMAETSYVALTNMARSNRTTSLTDRLVLTADINRQISEIEDLIAGASDPEAKMQMIVAAFSIIEQTTTIAPEFPHTISARVRRLHEIMDVSAEVLLSPQKKPLQTMSALDVAYILCKSDHKPSESLRKAFFSRQKNALRSGDYSAATVEAHCDATLYFATSYFTKDGNVRKYGEMDIASIRTYRSALHAHAQELLNQPDWNSMSDSVKNKLADTLEVLEAICASATRPTTKTIIHTHGRLDKRWQLGYNWQA